jgi:histidine triad (HIT) family protein
MAYDKGNIFARILRGEIPSNPVYEDEFVLAINDITPAAPVHVLVIPKGEYSSFHDFMANAPAALVQGYFAAIYTIAEKLGLAQNGYRLITNHGADAAQSVHHFHTHIIAGKQLGHLIP